MDRKSVYFPKGKEQEVGKRIARRRKRRGYKKPEDLVRAINKWSIEQEYIRIQNEYGNEIAQYLLARAEEIEDDEEIVRECADKIVENKYMNDPKYKMGKVFDGGWFVTRQALNQIEQGQREFVHKDTFEALCSVLKCTEEYLLLEDEYPNEREKQKMLIIEHIEEMKKRNNIELIMETLHHFDFINDCRVITNEDGNQYLRIKYKEKYFYASDKSINNMISDLDGFSETKILEYFKEDIDAL